MHTWKYNGIVGLFCGVLSMPSYADEQVLGYVKGSETMPAHEWETYQFVTKREGKGKGEYRAFDTTTELEYGVTDRFNVGVALKMQSLKSKGLVIDGYLPKDNSFDLKPSGYEIESKYSILSPAMDDFGLSVLWDFQNLWVDPHSGQKKNVYSFENRLLLQKYFLEGQLIWMGNLGLEATYAQRKAIKDLPDGFDWPTGPEMEIALSFGTGLSYRFIPNWFVGGEALWEAEYETEIGRERYSLFAGPSLHFGGEKFWSTLTWFPQIQGGDSTYPGQPENMHLIEKTKVEVRFKLGFNI